MGEQRDNCPNCGSHLPSGSRECPNCGRPTGESGGQRPPPGQSQQGPPPQQGGQGQPPQQGPPPGQNQQGPPPGQNQQGPPPQQAPPPQQGRQQDSGWNTGTLLLVIVGVVAVLVVGTVILAAVVGSFVLGLDSGTDGPHPVASFEYDYDPGANELVITHNGGDTLPADEVVLVGDIEGDGQTWADRTGAQEVTVTDSVTVTPTSDSYELRVVWQSQDTDDRIVLDEYRG